MFVGPECCCACCVAPVYAQHLVDKQVTLEGKALLDAVFDESGAVGAIDVVGGPAPGKPGRMVHMNR